MRFVDRSAEPAPASLTDLDGAGANELLSARAYYAANPAPTKAYPFEAYKGEDVKQTLRNLFHGKCAYCESRYAGTQPPDIEHYRPKGGVQDRKLHPGYWWLAMAWSNLLPACIDCNRRRGQVTAPVGMTLAQLEQALRDLGDLEPGGKQDAFPTLDDVWTDPEHDPDVVEQPLLIDPTRSDPRNHLVWVVGEVPVVIPLRDAIDEDCPRAIASIHIYALNRLGLVQCRAEVMRGLEAQAQLIRGLMKMAERVRASDRAEALAEIDEAVMRLRTFCDPTREFSAMAEAFISRFEAELAASIEAAVTAA